MSKKFQCTEFDRCQKTSIGIYGFLIKILSFTKNFLFRLILYSIDIINFCNPMKNKATNLTKFLTARSYDLDFYDVKE